MKIANLTNNQNDFMQNTKFKTLARLPYDFVRMQNFDKVRFFDETFFECKIFDEYENEYLIRCIRTNGNFYTTRENLKIIKTLYIWLD